MGFLKEGAKWAAKSLMATVVVEGGKKVAKEAANTYIKKQGKKAGENLAIKLAQKAGLVEKEPEKSDVEKALDFSGSLAKKAFFKVKSKVAEQDDNEVESVAENTETIEIEAVTQEKSSVSESFSEQADKLSVTASEAAATVKAKTENIGKVIGAFTKGLKNSK